MYQHAFRPPSKENYVALRATSLTDWCFFSTAFLFLNEIQYKASFESISFSTLDMGIDFAKNAKNEPILYSIAIE